MNRGIALLIVARMLAGDNFYFYEDIFSSPEKYKVAIKKIYLRNEKYYQKLVKLKLLEAKHVYRNNYNINIKNYSERGYKRR